MAFVAGRGMMTVEEWLRAAIADAERRGLPELKPLLEALARATDVLRRADFDDPAITELDGDAQVRHD